MSPNSCAFSFCICNKRNDADYSIDVPGKITIDAEFEEQQLSWTFQAYYMPICKFSMFVSCGVRMAKGFQGGDVVQLKSGGPKMLIYEIIIFEGEVKARCVWIEKGKKYDAAFPVISLQHASA